MKRRMCAAERVALEAVARPIVGLYVHRAADTGLLRRSSQCMTSVVVEVLRRGCMMDVSPSDSVRLSPTQQWLFALESVLRQLDRELGPAGRHVLVFRLTRTPKKEESSFGRIAIEINAEFQRAGRKSDVITTEEAEGLYRLSLTLFVKLLRARGIDRDESGSAAVPHAEPRLEPREESRLIAAGQALNRFAFQVNRRHSLRRGTAAVTIGAERAVDLYREAAARRGETALVVPAAVGRR